MIIPWASPLNSLGVTYLCLDDRPAYYSNHELHCGNEQGPEATERFADEDFSPRFEPGPERASRD